MARPQVAVGRDDLQIWRVAANILNKQSRTADRWIPYSLGVGPGLTTTTIQIVPVTKYLPMSRNWTVSLARHI
jgi:hypothetical protein